MKQALQVINELEQEGLIGRHAIGGAMALLFHDEPVATYDLDVFCVLPQSGLLVDLAPVYAALEARGFKAEGEAVVIGGVPVQLIPPYNALVVEALEHAEPKTFDGVPTRVIGFEYLIAIMAQTNRPKDRARLAMLAGNASIDTQRLDGILSRHGLTETWKSATRSS
jgi:hypothetical protein